MANYSPKHGASAADPKKEKKSGSKSTKPLIFIIIGILVVVIAVALAAIINKGDDPIFGLFTGGSAKATEPTTSLAKYYENGETPTTGTRHDVTLIPNGGASVSELVGRWSFDDVTSYEFDGAGRGIMHTDVDRYTFRYSAENGKLIVDFDIDDAMDAEFDYKISGNTLTMTRQGLSYTMTKAE